MSVTIPDCVRQAGDRAVAIYRKAIRKGESPRFAEMLALRQPPRSSGTDTTLFSGVGTLRSQIKNPLHRKKLRENARRMGIRLTGNELYQASLAKFPMDPRACISMAEGRTRIRKMAEANGAGCEGTVKVKAREPESEPKPKHKLHPQIVKRLVRQELANPANARVDRRELVEKVIDKHARKRK
jgi:hypothetical protein